MMAHLANNKVLTNLFMQIIFYCETQQVATIDKSMRSMTNYSMSWNQTRTGTFPICGQTRVVIEGEPDVLLGVPQ